MLLSAAPCRLLQNTTLEVGRGSQLLDVFPGVGTQSMLFIMDIHSLTRKPMKAWKTFKSLNNAYNTKESGWQVRPRPLFNLTVG